MELYDENKNRIDNRTELTGTSSVSKCDSILVYNTETFSDLTVAEKLGLGTGIIKYLVDPDIDHIGEIYNALVGTGVYEIIWPNNDGIYVIDNNRDNMIEGDGFNVIVFLQDGDILGYSYLASACGYFSTSGIDITRNYLMNKIYLSIETGLEEGEDEIITEGLEPARLVVTLSNTVQPSIIGEEPYQYSTAKTLLESTLSKGTYDIRVNSILREGKPKAIFTDTSILSVGSETKASRLGLVPLLQLSSLYSDFTHTSVGFYKGDIVLYVWNDDCQYSIFSLTKTLGDIFKDSSLSTDPYPYTVPNTYGSTVFNTEIYTLPGESQTIKYFSGRYAVVERKGVIKYRLLFDTVRQSFVKVGTEFVLDHFDVWEKVNSIEDLTWTTVGSSIDDVKDLSDTYINGPREVVSMQGQLIRRYGDWFVFSNTLDSTYIYSNMTKAVKISMTEPDPIVLNNQVILSKENTTEGIKYTLYNESGYFATPTVFKMSKGDPDSTVLYKDKWRALGEVDNTLTIKSTDSPSILMSSILSPFRRNILPTTLDGLEFIGAVGGIIYYRLGNIISYL